MPYRTLGAKGYHSASVLSGAKAQILALRLAIVIEVFCHLQSVQANIRIQYHN